MRVIKSLLLVGPALALGLGCHFNTLDNKSMFTWAPGSGYTVPHLYDRPAADVEDCVRVALSTLGTITEEKKLPSGEEGVTKTVFSARIDTRYVQVAVKPSKESPEVISDVKVMAWKRGWRSPDKDVAYETGLAIYNALVTASLQQTKK